MTQPRFPRLHPAQVCFVVDDVDAAVDECVTTFGWGPFHRFTAPVAEAQYRDWSGPKKTDVALGMAGGVQVELIHVHEGRDTVERYQTRYGAGFQHLGISCKDREQAIAALAEIGGVVDDQGEHPGIRFAFIDTPTGPGMFELLQEDGDTPPPGASEKKIAAGGEGPKLRVAVDRATIVTSNLDRAFAFYARAFRWEDVEIKAANLRIGAENSSLRRARGPAGQLEFELIEPRAGEDNPYTRHLARGDHGLVHAGGMSVVNDLPQGALLEAEWLEDGEVFGLYDWSGGAGSIQVRREMA